MKKRFALMAATLMALQIFAGGHSPSLAEEPEKSIWPDQPVVEERSIWPDQPEDPKAEAPAEEAMPEQEREDNMATKGMAVFRSNGEDYTVNDPNIANEFSALTSYAAGTYVNYQGNLYKFTTDHAAGSWNSAHVSQVLLGQDVSDLKSAIKDERSALYYEKNITEDVTTGAYIKTNVGIGNVVDLTPVENASFGYVVKNCIDGEKLVVTGSAGNNPRLWAFLDGSNKVLTLANQDATATNLEITAPASAMKVIINVNTNTAYNIVSKNALLQVKNYVDSTVSLVLETLSTNVDLSDGFQSGYIAMNYAPGNIISTTPTSSDSTFYKIINVNPGEKFIVTGYSGNASRLWGFIDYKNKLLAVEAAYETIGDKEITAPDDANRLILNSSPGTLPTIVVQVDGAVTQDVAGRLSETEKTGITVDSIVESAFIESEQLFDKNKLIAGKRYVSGVLTDDADYYLSDFIPVTAGSKYMIRGLTGQIVWFAENKKYLTVYAINSYDSPAQTLAPTGAYYCRVQMNKYFYPYVVTTVNKGETATKELQPGYLIHHRAYSDAQPFRFSDMPIPTEYSAIGTKAVDGTEDFDDTNPSVADIYTAFDALVTEFPDYITKEDLGMDQSNTYHLYAYYFNPESVPTENTMYRYPYPKVNLLSGIHGNGPSGDSNISLYCLYYFLKSLCHNWRESDALAYFRWNVRFAVLPIQNPYGVQNKTRQNSRGVDINRNFIVGWQSSTPGEADYGGTEPMSEAETQIIADFAETNKDAVFSTDIHSQYASPNQNQMSYISTMSISEMFYVAKSVVTKMSHLWDSQNIPGLTKMNFHGYVASPFSGWGTESAYMTGYMDIPSLTLEGFKNFSGSSYTNCSAEIVKMVADQLGYYLLFALNHFRNK